MPGFQSFFKFLHLSGLARLATSSIRVNVTFLPCNLLRLNCDEQVMNGGDT